MYKFDKVDLRVSTKLLATKTMMDTQMNLQNVSPSKISLFIGRRGMNLNKQVKFPSWKMFEALKKEGKPSLNLDIGVFRGDEKVQKGAEHQEGDEVRCIITSDSEEMMKFAQHNLAKYHEKFSSRSEGGRKHTFYASLQHDYISHLIGRRGETIRSLKEEACEYVEDLREKEKLMKVFPKCNQHTYIGGDFPEDLKEATSAFLKLVNEDENASFIGWPPDDSKEEEFVTITVSSFAKEESFNDFIDSFKDAVHEKVGEINTQQRRFEDEGQRFSNEMETALNATY